MNSNQIARVESYRFNSAALRHRRSRNRVHEIAEVEIGRC